MAKTVKKILSILLSTVLCTSLFGINCHAAEMKSLTVVMSGPEYLKLADGTTIIQKGGEFTITEMHQIVVDKDTSSVSGDIKLGEAKVGNYEGTSNAEETGVILDPGVYSWNMAMIDLCTYNIIFTKLRDLPTPEPEEKHENYITKLEEKLTELIGVVQNDTPSDAPAKPQTVEWDAGDSLPLGIMKQLQETPNVSLLFSFTYEGVDHMVLIPAGEAFVDEDITWYGPLWLLGKYGEYDPNKKEYTIESGDNLKALAKKFGMSLEELIAKNPQIKDPTKIYPGQVINY